MEYRVVRPEEMDRWREFQQYCFLYPQADLDSWISHAFDISLVRGLYAADGTMLSTLINNVFALYVDGAEIPMGGIANVASVPETRRGGHTGKLLTECIRESREQSIPLSSLYPFKQSFYRRYGWEVASAWHVHTIPIGLLDGYRKAGGAVKRYRPLTEDWRELEAIYARFAAPRRGYMVRRTERHWRSFISGLWLNESRRAHVAVWSPREGAVPEGYLLYRFERGEKTTLIIRELVACTPEAERGLWGFVAQHDSQVREVQIRLQRDYPLWHLVEHAGDCQSELHSGWMLRIIDVKDAFERRPWPADHNLALTFGFTDAQAPWNEGTWRLEVEGGHASLRPAPAETPSLTGPVQTWSQLYTGLVRPEQAAWNGRLTVSDERTLRDLSHLVNGEPFFFYEYF